MEIFDTENDDEKQENKDNSEEESLLNLDSLFDSDSSNNIDNSHQNNEIEVKIPKKRGRQPKNYYDTHEKPVPKKNEIKILKIQPKM